METPTDLSDNSPVYSAKSNKLQMFVDDEGWPLPVILCNAETEKAERKAKRRISE